MAATEKRGVDVIIDLVGGPGVRGQPAEPRGGRPLREHRPAGRTDRQIDLEQLWLKRLKLIGVTFRTRSEQERLAMHSGLRARHAAVPARTAASAGPSTARFALDEIHAAHAYMMQAPALRKDRFDH